MPPEQLLQLLRAQPFLPFRIHLTDGRQLDVRHPELCMASRHYALVGIPDQAGEGFISRHETVAMSHIVSLEPLQLPAQASGASA